MWKLEDLVVFILRSQCNLCAGCMVFKKQGENHHTRMTPFLLGGGPHFALIFFLCVFLNPDAQCI